MKKLKDILKESNVQIGKVYSNPYATAFVKENEEQKEPQMELSEEQKKAFLEAVKQYKKYGEAVYRNAGLGEVYESIKNMVEMAGKVTISETDDWFDNVTVSRHMKRMGESFKVFEKTLKEVSTLQQRLEASYDEIGEVLGKYYEISEELDPVGKEDGDIDNDGDEDASDEYLANRRKVISKAMKNESMKLTDMISVNEGRKSKDATGVRFAEAVYSNVYAIEDLIVNEKKDPKEVIPTMGPVLLNAINACLKHNYKPNPKPAFTLKRDLERWGDISNQERIDIFKKSLMELKKVVESLIKRPSKAGVKKLIIAHRDWWNYNYGANIALNGEGAHHNTIIESELNERAEPMLTDKEQEIVRKSLERATGVSVDTEVSDVRYHNGNSDFLFDGGEAMMLYVGRDDNGYYVSIEGDGGNQIAMKDAKDFKSIVKVAMQMAKKYKKRLTSESMKLTDMISVNEASLELKKLEDAIKMFQDKIEKQGRVTNARDEEHLQNLIKVYKQMGGKNIKESVNEAYGNTKHVNDLLDYMKTASKNLNDVQFIKSVVSKFPYWKNRRRDLDSIKQMWNDYKEDPKGWDFWRREYTYDITESVINEANYKVGDTISVTLKGGKKVIKGKVEKLNPLKVRTGPTDVVTLGNHLIQSIVKESVVNEAKYDIGMARKGNGITVYNRAEEEAGDYKNIAHISDNGVVKYYDKKLPNNVKKKIEAEAQKMKESVNESKSMKLTDMLNESMGKK